jgi:ribosomal protein L31
MEVIRPGRFEECITCPRVDERVEYENLNPDKLVFKDDFTAEKIDVTCTVEEGPVTRIYMDVWFEGHFTHNNVQRKQGREGRLKEVHLCPHFGDQKL